MFSRSHSRSHGFGKDKDKDKDKSREAIQLSALAELGLIGHDESKSRSSGGATSRRKESHRPNFSSSSAATFIGGATYPEKCRWTESFFVWWEWWFWSLSGVWSGPFSPRLVPRAPLNVFPTTPLVAVDRCRVDDRFFFFGFWPPSSVSNDDYLDDNLLTLCSPSSRPLDRLRHPPPALAPLVPLDQLAPVPGQQQDRPQQDEFRPESVAPRAHLCRQRMCRLRGAPRAHAPRREDSAVLVLPRLPRGLLLRVHARVRRPILPDVQRAPPPRHQPRRQRAGHW